MEFSSPMNHPENACTCSRDRRCGCKRILIGSTRSPDKIYSPLIVLGVTLTAPVNYVETFMMGSSPNQVLWSVRRSVKMSEFSVTRKIYFHPPVFYMALYHCLLSLEVRSIEFISNGSIAVDYLGVGTGRTSETAVVTAVVMAPVRADRNAAGTALGIAGAVALSSSPVFTAASSGASLFARPAIVQPF